MAGYGDRLEGERSLAVLTAWMAERLAREKKLMGLDTYLGWFKPKAPISGAELVAGFRAMAAAGLPVTITEIPDFEPPEQQD